MNFFTFHKIRISFLLIFCFSYASLFSQAECSPDGGTITSLLGLTEVGYCAGNVFVPVSHTTTATGLSYWYIITDVNDNILDWVNPLATEDSLEVTLDLSAAPPGECHIWGWSFTEQALPVIGASITSLDDDDCEDISSNFIRVNKATEEDCITLSINKDFKEKLSIQYGPLPFKDNITFFLKSSITGQAIHQIYNSNGSLLKSNKFDLFIGNNNQNFNLGGLPPGIYSAVFLINNQLAAVHKLIKQ